MEIKERIIIESLKLFMRYGIRSITMDTIADKLGVSKRTIYELFKDKDSLLVHCLISKMKEEEKITDELLWKSANIIDGFLSHIRRSVNIIKSINPLFFHDIKKYHSAVFQYKGKERDEKSYKMTVKMLQQGKQEGYFREHINVDIIAILIKEQFEILGNDEIFPPDKYAKSELFENIAINFIRGISTSKGIAIIDHYKF